MQINYVRISGKSCHKPSNIIRTISISFAVKNVGSDTEMVLLLNPFTAKGGGHQCSWWMEGHPPQGQGQGQGHPVQLQQARKLQDAQAES